MNTNFEINWLAVLVGSLAYFFLGALWYSKLLFASRWISYCKIDMNNPEAKKGVGGIMLSSFVLMFITSVGLAILRDRLDLTGWMSGFKVGALTGICFGACSISVSYLYEKRPMGLHFINNGYTILGNILSAIIIFSWN